MLASPKWESCFLPLFAPSLSLPKPHVFEANSVFECGTVYRTGCCGGIIMEVLVTFRYLF